MDYSCHTVIITCIINAFEKSANFPFNSSSLSTLSAGYGVILLLQNHSGMQLLHDGAPVYRERATTAYLYANNVNVVDTPPPPQKKKKKNHQT